MCKKGENFETKEHTMRLKKTISFIMALLLLSMTLVGCSVMRYDAEIYSYVNDCLAPTFLKATDWEG